MLALTACSSYDFVDAVTYSSYSIFAMDTVIDIRLNDEVDESIFKECETIVKTVENKLSETVADSEISILNASQGEPVDATNSAELIRLAFDVTEKTYGAFDITLEPVCALWDVTDESFDPPNDEALTHALAHVGADKFVLDGNCISKLDGEAGVDLGGIGKGYAAQVLAEHLASLGYTGTVSFGGNIGTVGSKLDGAKWNIAIKSPFDTDAIVGTVKLDKGFIAVSGAYERYKEIDGVIYHHIIDPDTGRPSESDLASAAVICDNGALADALSTALFVLGSEAALGLYNENVYDFEAVLIKNNGDIILTDALENGAFTPYNG